MVPASRDRDAHPPSQSFPPLSASDLRTTTCCSKQRHLMIRWGVDGNRLKCLKREDAVRIRPRRLLPRGYWSMKSCSCPRKIVPDRQEEIHSGPAAFEGWIWNAQGKVLTQLFYHQSHYFHASHASFRHSTSLTHGLSPGPHASKCGENALPGSSLFLRNSKQR